MEAYELVIHSLPQDIFLPCHYCYQWVSLRTRSPTRGSMARTHGLDSFASAVALSLS